MEELKVGDSVFVQSYKHNGALHRTWSKALVIDVCARKPACRPSPGLSSLLN